MSICIVNRRFSIWSRRYAETIGVQKIRQFNVQVAKCHDHANHAYSGPKRALLIRTLDVSPHRQKRTPLIRTLRVYVIVNGSLFLTRLMK